MLARPLGALAEPPELRPDQSEFRALYQELVETDTSATTGSCTALAAKIAGHLRGAGYTDDQITLFSARDRPLEGGLVVGCSAIPTGTGPTVSTSVRRCVRSIPGGIF